MTTRYCLDTVLCLLPASALAQTVANQDGGAYHLAVQSRLIDTTLLVRGADGKPLLGLPQTAFHIREDGTDQTIRYFATMRELPLSIGLLVDVSGSQEKFLKEHEQEIASFLSEVMSPRDRAHAPCFGNHLRLTSDWTASPKDFADQSHHQSDRRPSAQSSV